MILWRIQDKDGRGPFRPGFSKWWLDAKGHDFPPIYEALGVPPGDLWRLCPEGMHVGCACRSLEQLRAWFSRAERRRLAHHGYEVVAFTPDVIVRDLGDQVFFAMRHPLRELAGRERA